ncbi:uncharacterized protein LOC106693223 [Microplitis demolitor]|uniref:uncharacterized protein LOC106693223 n=1 Tax=Microplitis demolitor TaxID=69319 RepID=UPI0006D4F031|nr:uncharacterized protein LOC106693223 [Microplitis demolitor]
MAFIINFLDRRSITVKIGNVLSKTQYLKNGVPQGTVIAVTLFLIAINEIISIIELPAMGMWFADDGAVACRGKNINTCVESIQVALNKLQEWRDVSGFKFSEAKSEFMVFSRSNKIIRPTLLLGEFQLRQVAQMKIFGLIFDPKLKWNAHLKELKSEGKRRMNIIKCLASTKWGADSEVLINMYKAIIRAKLDYGAIFYNSANPGLLQLLDTIQTTSLRLAIDGFKSSPTHSILA